MPTSGFDKVKNSDYTRSKVSKSFDELTFLRFEEADVPRIETVYICNHTHTDIGFTDFQEVCFRQHAEFYEQALDLIERTADYPEAARFRWTCEVTGPLMRYLGAASDKQLERFLNWHQRGFMDVAGMQYNLTPLLNLEQMRRSLYPLKKLRELGFSVTSAMQDDVNGISWAFADLFAEVGIDFYTAAINPIRGARPKPFPGAFWWEGPSGKRVLSWNGFHYLFGRSQAKLGNWDFVDRFLPVWTEQLEADDDYPYDFLYCEATHPVRVDNGPPDLRMSDFVRRWNDEGRIPKLELTTVSAFGKLLRNRYQHHVKTQRGDWTDHWTDGVGSSAFETGLNRQTHELLLMGETLESWLQGQSESRYDVARYAKTYEHATLYDEHTWGAYTSIEAPQALFSKAQWNHKAGYAYTAAMQAHDALARVTHTFRKTVAEMGPEGMFNLGDLSAKEAFPPSGKNGMLVINTLPWARTVNAVVPQARGATAPVGMLDCFFTRETGWGGNKPVTPLQRLRGTVPPMGYTFLSSEDEAPARDLKTLEDGVENAFYRIRVNPDTGALAEWFDKTLDHDFAGSYQNLGSGQYLYETVTSDEDRLAIATMDFSLPNFYVGETGTPWQRRSASQVTVNAPKLEAGRASIEVDIVADGVAGATCVFSLETETRCLAVDWTLDKTHVTEPEAVFIAFPFNLGKPEFKLDLNGIPSRPNDDQLDGAARDWFPVQRWVDVSDSVRGVTVVPLDAPLMQLGGITTGRWVRTLEPDSATLMSWALNNHWPVNFRASQGGMIPLRYRLQTHAGPVDVAAAARFGAEMLTPPIVLRDAAPLQDRDGQFLNVPDDAPVLLTAKPADDGEGVILRLQNLSDANTRVPVTFSARSPRAASRCTALEENQGPLELAGNTLSVVLEPLQQQSLRVWFAS